MRLRSVEISDFKSYGRNTDGIRLADINLVIGANGAGKSNFVSFLEMIAFMMSDGFDDYVARNGFARSLLHFGMNAAEELGGKLSFTEEGGQEWSYAFSIKPSTSGGLYIAKERIRNAMGYDREWKGGGHRTGLLGEKRDPSVRNMLTILRGCRTFHFHDTSVNARIRTPGYVQDNAYLRSDAGNLAAFLYGLQIDERKEKYYHRIVRVIRSVFPQFGGFEIRPYGGSGGGDSSVLLNWNHRGDDELFGPHMLSDGTIRFIALAALLLQPEDMLPDVLIIDEPEIGLHPAAIRVLGEMVREVSRHSQIIITTQSSMLLEEFSCNDVLVAEYDHLKKTSCMRRLEEEDYAEWLSEYSLGELWDKNVIGGNP